MLRNPNSRQRSLGTRTLVAAIAIAAVGCSSSANNNPDQCNVRIVNFTPDNATVAVGDTVAFHAAYVPGIAEACVPAVPATSLRWGSTTAAITIDSLTGLAVAHQAGPASVTVHLPSSSNGLGATQVTVISR